MANGRAGRLLGRLALRAGQLLLSGVLLIVTAPLWLACTLVLMVLLVARPFIVAILVTLTTPTYLLPLFQTSLGNMWLGIAAVMMGMGIFIMNRMIQFDF